MSKYANIHYSKLRKSAKAGRKSDSEEQQNQTKITKLPSRYNISEDLEGHGQFINESLDYLSSSHLKNRNRASEPLSQSFSFENKLSRTLFPEDRAPRSSERRQKMSNSLNNSGFDPKILADISSNVNLKEYTSPKDSNLKWSLTPTSNQGISKGDRKVLID